MQASPPYRLRAAARAGRADAGAVLDAAAHAVRGARLRGREHRRRSPSGRRLRGDRLRPLRQQARTARRARPPCRPRGRPGARARAGRARALAAATDQHEQLRLFAADIVLRLERAAPLVAIVAGASRSEPELADLLARLHADRLKNLAVLVDALAANGPLRLPSRRSRRNGLGAHEPRAAPAPRPRPRLDTPPLPRLARRQPRRASPPIEESNNVSTASGQMRRSEPRLRQRPLA